MKDEAVFLQIIQLNEGAWRAGRQPAVRVMQEYVILFIEINLETAAPVSVLRLQTGLEPERWGKAEGLSVQMQSRAA